MFSLGQIRHSLKPQTIVFERKSEQIASHMLTENQGQELPSFWAFLGESFF